MSFGAGLRDVSPLFLGIVPFGIISGVTAVSVGLSATQAMGMSVIVLGGSSQIAALELMQDGAFWLIVLATTFMINLRHVMYSASLAPRFASHSLLWRCLIAYHLVDYTYALSIHRFSRDPAVDRRGYALGVGVSIAVVWHASTAVGVVVGAQVPPSLSLDYAIPLVFLVLLFPAVTDRATVAAACTAAATAVVAHGLPLNLGLISAAVAGIAVGLVVEATTPGAVSAEPSPRTRAERAPTPDGEPPP